MNRKTLFAIVIIIIISALSAFAHDQKAAVVVDTDCAPDDLRAICLLLADPHIDIKGITITEGACSCKVGYQKVMTLLNELGEKDIPVAIGSRGVSYTPPWRQFAESVSWGKSLPEKEIPSLTAAQLIRKVVVSEENPSLIMLGSMANLYSYLQLENNGHKKIASVLWFSNTMDTINGENYNQDHEAAAAVLESGLPIKIYNNLKQDGPRFHLTLFKKIKGIFNPYAQLIANSHSSPEAMKRVKTAHFGIWDELIPIWFSRPELFKFTPSDRWQGVYFANIPPEADVHEAFLDILTSAGGRQASVVLKQFPQNPESYRKDLAGHAEAIIKRHGEEEWRLVVLTSELHRHLGVYSIVGAKMGLRARELMHAHLDQVNVVSYAGLKPPISCLNDGLQISTGATLGQGKIKVIEENTSVKAEFYFKGFRLTLSLKSEIIADVKARIKKGVKEYGLNSPLYWKYVRENAIRLWLELDRKEIFEEKLETLE